MGGAPPRRQIHAFARTGFGTGKSPACARSRINEMGMGWHTVLRPLGGVLLMSDRRFAVTDGAHKFCVRYLVPVMDNGVLDRVLAGAGNVREAQALGGSRSLGPLDFL